MGLASFNAMRRRQATLKVKPESKAVKSADYDSMSYKELTAVAADRGINHVGIKKIDLIEAIKASE